MTIILYMMETPITRGMLQANFKAINLTFILQ